MYEGVLTDDGEQAFTPTRRIITGSRPPVASDALRMGGQSTTPHWPSSEEFEIESI